MKHDESGEFADNEVVYTYTVNDDNSFTILFHGEPVLRSRAYRLAAQAHTGARDWLAKTSGEINPLEGITLDVQNLSVDAKGLFGKG